MFRYKAIENGTLGPPHVDFYRFVNAGEIVVSPKELPKSRWLIPVAEAAKIKPLPITSAMNIYGDNQKHVFTPPKIESTGYDNNMKVLIENENRLDGVEPVVEVNQVDGGEESSGDQDVL